jgi:protein disulfide-isomerase A1
MVGLKATLLFALVLLASAELPEEDDVLVLDQNNFEEALNTYPDILVEFYAPWCGHCKKLAPEYARAAGILKARDPAIRIAKVDATVSPDLASKYGVKGYPTLKYFVDKNPTDYTGGRVEADIVSWILKKSGPVFRLVDANQLKVAIDNSPAVFVLFAESVTAEFEKVAKAVDKLEFLVSVDPETQTSFEAKAGSLVLFKNFDEKKAVYEGNGTAEDIINWLNASKRPSVMPFNDDAIEHIFKNANPALFIFRSESEADTYNTLLNQLSTKLRGVIALTYADLNSEPNKRLADYLGLTANQQPLAFLVDSRNPLKKYKYEGELTVDAIAEFTGKWKDGQLKPSLKSEPIPSDPFDGSVRVLVGKNFAEVVYDTTKDVFVEFYAPWCGHCKSLAPEYERVAETFQSEENVIVAKMDSTGNEVDGISISGFPTLKFYPANNKAGIDYNGDRNEQGITEFIRKNAVAKKAEPEPEAERKVEL